MISVAGLGRVVLEGIGRHLVSHDWWAWYRPNSDCTGLVCMPRVLKAMKRGVADPWT